MRYYTSDMSKENRDRYRRTMNGSFRKVVEYTSPTSHKPRLMKGLETYQALLSGSGKSIVNDNNWSGYVKRSNTNDSVRPAGNREIYYDKEVTSSDGGSTSTETVANFITQEVLNRGSFGENTTVTDSELGISRVNVIQSLENFSFILLKKYCFGLKAFSFGYLRGNVKSLKTYQSILKFGNPLGEGHSKWDDADAIAFCGYVSDLMKILNYLGEDSTIALVESCKMVGVKVGR